MLVDMDLLTYAQFQTDIISTLSKLFLLLQSEQCLVSEVYFNFMATVGVLSELKERYEILHNSLFLG